MEQLKRCPGCQEEKPVGEFWKSKYTKNGRRPRCKVCSIKKHRDKIKANPVVSRRIMRASRRKAKERVLAHYGNQRLACVHCGESRTACLTIDHIEGGGTKHFKELGKYGSAFYQWLISNKYPKGYQTLCANCQLIKRFMNDENGKIKESPIKGEEMSVGDFV